MTVPTARHEVVAPGPRGPMHLLGHHPDQQRRVQQEVDTVLGGRSLTAEEASKLPDTTAAIKEAMRLYPPVPALGRLAPAGDQIGGRTIPPGAIVVLSPWVTHRRPDFWPDPHRFNPDRFHPTETAAWTPEFWMIG